MKLIGIAGSIADKSYNRMLLKYMSNKFNNLVDIELLDINDIPMFNQSNNVTNSASIQYLNRKIMSADGVIIATPEHNHTIPAALKSIIEWLSYDIHPLTDKPVMIVGASYHNQGSSRAQLNLRQILESPGVNAITMPGNEFLLANAKQAFDDNGNLIDEHTSAFLKTALEKFIKFVNVISKLNGRSDNPGSAEDMTASGTTDTTVEGIEKTDPEWLEKAAVKTKAVNGKTYVKLDRGLLTVDQLNWFLNSMPMELTFADDNNQFIYYNRMSEEPNSMLAKRNPSQVGNSLADVHPKRALKGASNVVNALRTGKTNIVKMPVPGNGPTKHLMHYYKAMHDEQGNYRGINEFVLDLWPIVKYYLDSTGQKLIDDPNSQVSATTGASENSDSNTTSNVSEEITTPDVDSTSGASEN